MNHRLCLTALLRERPDAGTLVNPFQTPISCPLVKRGREDSRRVQTVS